MDRPALVGKAVRGKDLALLDMPDKVLDSLGNYVGAMAANRAAGTMAVSSPTGNSYVVFDTRTGAIVSSRDLTEVCGIAPDRGGFIASAGTGAIVAASGERTDDPGFVWDNHMLRMPAG